MSEKTVEHWRYMLDGSGEMIFEGETIAHSPGGVPKQQRLARKYGSACINCGRGPVGVFTVEKSPALGFLPFLTIDNVTFTCVGCWEEEHPEYDYADAKHDR